MKHLISIFLLLVLCSVFAPLSFSDDDLQGMKNDHDFFAGSTVDPRKKADAEVRDDTKRDQTTFQDSILFTRGGQIIRQSYNTRRHYYLQVARQHGWIVGVGRELTPAEISHIQDASFYELSLQDADGHYHMVRGVDAQGNTESRLLASVIHTGYHGAWKTQSTWTSLKPDVDEIRLYSTPGDSRPVSEAYLSDGQLKFMSSIRLTSQSTDRITFTGTDGVVLPLTDNSQSNGVQVSVTYDSCGYVHTVMLLNRYDEPVLNTDSSFVELRTHDRNGATTFRGSADLFGHLVNDNTGNSGWCYICNDYGQTDSCWSINKDRVVVPGPDYARVSYRYDKWHREIASYRWTVDNQAYLNPALGWHQRRTYNDAGMLLTSHQYYGNRRQSDARISVIDRRYDRQGRQVANYQYDVVDGQVTDKSVKHTEYLGDTVRSVVYVFDQQGDSSWFSIKAESPTYYYAKYAETGNSFIKHFDANHGVITQYTLDGDGNPRAWTGDNTPYFAYHNDHQSLGQGRGYTHTYRINPDGTLFRGENGSYYDEHRWQDTLANTETVAYFLEDGSVYDRYSVRYDDLKTRAGSIDLTQLNDFGHPAWVLRDGDLRYMQRHIFNDEGKVIARQFFNEFGEPTYLSNGNGTAYASSVYSYDWKHFDLDGTPLADNNAERTLYGNSPKCLIIEVKDSLAYSYGIRDGDRLISYAGWHMPLTGRLDTDPLVREAVFNYNKPKSALLLRMDPQHDTCYMVPIPALPVGSFSDLGIALHRHCNTPREDARLRSAIRAWIGQSPQDSVFFAHDNDEGCYRYSLSIEPKLNRDAPLLKKGIRDPFYVLAISRQSELSAQLGHQVDATQQAVFTEYRSDRVRMKDFVMDEDQDLVYTYYYTCDGVTVDTFQVKGNVMGCYYSRQNLITRQQADQLTDLLLSYDEEHHIISRQVLPYVFHPDSADTVHDLTPATFFPAVSRALAADGNHHIESLSGQPLLQALTQSCWADSKVKRGECLSLSFDYPADVELMQSFLNRLSMDGYECYLEDVWYKKNKKGQVTNIFVYKKGKNIYYFEGVLDSSCVGTLEFSDSIITDNASAAGTQDASPAASSLLVNIDHPDSVKATSTDVYTQNFSAGVSVVIYVSGDGSTDLDLFVYDEADNLVASDTDNTDNCVCVFTPSSQGTYKIKIRNLGDQPNQYSLQIRQ